MIHQRLPKQLSGNVVNFFDRVELCGAVSVAAAAHALAVIGHSTLVSLVDCKCGSNKTELKRSELCLVGHDQRC